MRLLIVGLNYAPEKVGVAVYTTGMAEALAADGHDVHVICGQPYYPAWRTTAGYDGSGYTHSVENGVSVRRVPHYVPANPTGGKRLVHHASFAAAALLPAIWQGLAWRPDVVLTLAPSLIGAPTARLAAALAGAPSWLHVQDFEVEAAFATGLLKGGLVAKLARSFEAAVLRSFQHVSSISPEMCRRLIDKGVAAERISEFRNWAETGAVRPMTVPSAFRREWSIDTEHVALYSGNIANKQGIDIVVEAAARLQRRQDLTFVICGEGPNRARLEERAQGLRNVQFHDLQPKERLSELMGLATVHLLPQLAVAADLLLPSKLTNMLASGRPVVATAATGTGLAREVEGCGLVVPPEDASAFAGAIEILLDDGEFRTAAGIAARQRADERWSKARILRTFAHDLGQLTSAAPRLARQWRDG